MKSPRTDQLEGAEPDDEALDVRFVQRSLTTLRDRVRMQEDEIDTLRAMVRTLQKNAPGDQLSLYQDRLTALEAGLHDVQAADSDRAADAAADRVRSEFQARFSALEAGRVESERTLQQMRETIARTDSNLHRLLVEIDRLVTEVARRPEPPPPPEEHSSSPEAPSPDPGAPAFDSQIVYPRFRWRVPAFLAAGLVILFLAVWLVSSRLRGTAGGVTADAGSALSSIDQGRLYESQKNYPKAEALYRDILKKDPNNPEAIRRLAGVLFNENKIEESAAVLQKLSQTN